MNLTILNASLTRKILLFIFILSSFLLITCRKENDKPDKSKTGNNPLEALDYISDEDLAKGNLGNIAFTVDPTLTDSATFEANSEDYTVLMVEDANGYGWMLSIPPHALMEDQLITMTAISSIDVSNTAARIRSGVLFEPDGVQFLDKVMLTEILPFRDTI